MTDEAMLDAVLVKAIAYVKRSLEPVQFQHRYRMPLIGGPRWSKWSGWKNGPIRGRIDGWEYEERGLYAL